MPCRLLVVTGTPSQLYGTPQRRAIWPHVVGPMLCGRHYLASEVLFVEAHHDAEHLSAHLGVVGVGARNLHARGERGRVVHPTHPQVRGLRARFRSQRNRRVTGGQGHVDRHLTERKQRSEIEVGRPEFRVELQCGRSFGQVETGPR